MVQTAEQPVYRLIADDLRARIDDKHQPGDLLPSEADLSAHYKAHRHTIRHALGLLSQENIIRRHHGRGSVVLDRKAVGEFAIILRPQLLSADAHPYYSQMNGLLIKLLQERNPRWQVRLHVGKITETGEQFPATLDLLAPDILRNLRGVFAYHSLHELGPQLHDAKVPIVMLNRREGACVTNDPDALFNLGLAHLKERGCRTVGLIWAALGEQHIPTHQHMISFRRAAEACGFDIRPEWTSPCICDTITEQHGYETMIRLWENPSHPDGLIVVDDIMCRGVLRASLQRGIELPRDLRLVTHAGCGIVLNYHKPVTRVEYDTVEQAKLAVDIMLTLVEGRTPSTAAIKLPGVLINGETT